MSDKCKIKYETQMREWKKDKVKQGNKKESYKTMVPTCQKIERFPYFPLVPEVNI